MEGRRTPHTAFGRRLREELLRQGVSGRELARRLNPDDPDTARRSVARWLSPEPKPKSAVPSPGSRRAVEAALGLAPDTLAEEEADLPLSREEFFQLSSLLKKAMGAAA